MDISFMFQRSESTFPLQNIKQPSHLEIVLLAATALFLAVFTLQGIAWDRPDPYSYIYFERPQLKPGQEDVRKLSTRNIAKHLDILQKDLVVLWGSQSGTAESLAHRLSRDLHVRFGLSILTADLSDYDPASIAAIPASKIVILILATYGEGGPSDNAMEFWDWITHDNMPDLSNLKLLTFGLGNSNYKYFNKVVDEASTKLKQAGATLLSPVGRADDAESTTEEDYLAWVEDVHGVLQRELHILPQPLAYTPSLSVSSASNTSCNDLYINVTKFRNQRRTGTKTSVTKPLPICVSEDRSAPSSGRSCLHIELDLTEFPELRYKTGDHLAVWPINPEDEVNRLLTILGRTTTADDAISVEVLDASDNLTISTPTTLRTLLRHQLEICGPVSRSTAIELIEFAPSEESRALLSHLGGDRNEFAQFRARSYVTFSSLLEYTSKGDVWTTLPLSYLIERIPALQSRYYSISSSSVLSPRRLSITVRVSNKVLPNKDAVTIPGLASNYLLALSRNSAADPSNPRNYDLSGRTPLVLPATLHCHIRRTTFKLPVATTTPVIMIANGTGIAPFRAFIQERAKLQAVGRSVGRMILFFGCRRPDTDYLYGEELKEIQRTLNASHLSTSNGESNSPDRTSRTLDNPGNLLDIRTAFSRLNSEEQTNQARGYVQDVVSNELATVVSMLDEENASIYVCGGSNMSRGVGAHITRGYAELKSATADQGAEWVNGLKRAGKWMEDVWD
ncbi:Fc.00g055930.m01.CDS01 [Cosmosporella sp. VM-42]